MIQFHHHSLTKHYYSLILTGDAGEQQLIITAAWGQDRCCSLAIVRACCDGDVVVMHQSRPTRYHNPRYTPKKALEIVERCLNSWGMSGVNGTPEQMERHRREVVAAMAAISKHWYINNID